MLVRMSSCHEYQTEILPQGHHYVEIALDELVFFVRNKKAIPFAETANNTAEIDISALQSLGYPDCSYTLYWDNGISANPEDSLTVLTL